MFGHTLPFEGSQMPYLVKLRDDVVGSGVLVAGRPERLTVVLRTGQ